MSQPPRGCDERMICSNSSSSCRIISLEKGDFAASETVSVCPSLSSAGFGDVEDREWEMDGRRHHAYDA